MTKFGSAGIPTGYDYSKMTIKKLEKHKSKKAYILKFFAII